MQGCTGKPIADTSGDIQVWQADNTGNYDNRVTSTGECSTCNCRWGGQAKGYEGKRQGERHRRGLWGSSQGWRRGRGVARATVGGTDREMDGNRSGVEAGKGKSGKVAGQLHGQIRQLGHVGGQVRHVQLQVVRARKFHAVSGNASARGGRQRRCNWMAAGRNDDPGTLAGSERQHVQETSTGRASRWDRGKSGSRTMKVHLRQVRGVELWPGREPQDPGPWLVAGQGTL